MKSLLLSFTLLCFLSFNSNAQSFTLSSSSLQGQFLSLDEFNGFGCSGENQSPQLSWKNAPANTKSFAITMYDPDAPTGSGWWHWLVFDLPADLNSLPKGAGATGGKALPEGCIQSPTDYGSPGYGGPCPPEGHGDHQYIITVYALDVAQLGLNATTNAAVVGYYLGNHTIAKASIVAYYGR
ncbi:MAG: YbhB/YbcL family Raf kinase inhibitor-like protein [Salibacteraceae bacterium]